MKLSREKVSSLQTDPYEYNKKAKPVEIEGSLIIKNRDNNITKIQQHIKLNIDSAKKNAQNKK